MIKVILILLLVFYIYSNLNKEHFDEKHLVKSIIIDVPDRIKNNKEILKLLYEIRYYYHVNPIIFVTIVDGFDDFLLNYENALKAGVNKQYYDILQDIHEAILNDLNSMTLNLGKDHKIIDVLRRHIKLTDSILNKYEEFIKELYHIDKHETHKKINNSYQFIDDAVSNHIKAINYFNVYEQY